jgi:hypothetical protein
MVSVIYERFHKDLDLFRKVLEEYGIFQKVGRGTPEGAHRMEFTMAGT